jgi:hypothetical protein
MTEREALVHTLEYVQSPFNGHTQKIKAARAFFVLAWLEDKNWRSEMSILLERVRNTDYLNTAFKELEQNDRETSKLYAAMSLLNHIFGWGLATAEWSDTKGAPLIDELWGIINNKEQTCQTT